MSRSNVAEADGSVSRAIESFRRGRPICIHDAIDREGETDLVYPAHAITPADVSRLRNDAGGLICVALPDDVAGTFDLPFLQETLDHPTAVDHDLTYDDRSSFSLTVNHRETRTGITDQDRALTITALADAAETPDTTDFEGVFRTPGHVHLLRGAPDLLADRQGHTELALALAQAASVPPAAVVCEMLDDETGRALSRQDAATYANEHGLVYVEGSDLIEQLSSN